MAKKKVSLQRTGAFALAMTTALSTLSFSAANAAQSSHDTDTIDVPDTDTVTKVITDYQATLDREWTDSSASTGASTLTSAEQTVHYIRDGLIEDGVPVTSASSEVRERAMGHHRAILDAIAAGDPRAAERAMSAHMDQTARDAVARADAG